MNMEHKALFDTIKVKVSEVVNEEFIKSTKTEKGNTQISERVVIEKIREVLTALELTFQEAGSQQSKDFRNVGGIGLDIEIKKTDSPVIYFNDTCPSKDIYYIVLFTGKEYKRTPEKNIPAKLLFINGEEFIHDSPWIHEYIEQLTILKDKYARGENKKKLAGIMEVYPRPTFKANISKFLCDNKPCEPETETIKLCVNMDCVRYPPDWDFEEDTEETYQVGQWQKCCLCDGYFYDDGMGDILYIQEEPNNQEAECDLCGKSEDIVQMKGTGQYLCGNACDEEEEEEDEEEEEEEEDVEEDEDEFTCQECSTVQGKNNCELCDVEDVCEECYGQGGDYGPGEIWVCHECLPTCLECEAPLYSANDECCGKGRSDEEKEEEKEVFGMDNEQVEDLIKEEASEAVEEEGDECRYITCKECDTPIDCYNDNINIVYKGGDFVNNPREELVLCTMCFQDMKDELIQQDYKCDDWDEEEEEEEEEDEDEYLKELEIERISNGECPKISHDLYLSRLTSEQRVAEKENGRLWEIRLKEINIQHEKELAEDEDGLGCNECYACVTGGAGPCVKEKEKND